MADLKTINSKDNPNIKLYMKLSSSRKFRREYGLFTLEGFRLIEDAIAENAVLQCVFITDSFLAKHGDAHHFLPEYILNRTFVIPDELGARLSDTDGTQGIFSVCHAIDNADFSVKIITGGKYILLHNIQDPGNLGTIIRTADAVGVDSVITVNCCDIYNPKVIRSTMGSLFRLPVFDLALEDAFDLFRIHDIKTFAAVIDSDAVSLSDCVFLGGCAILIGNEGNGLPSDVVSLCDDKLTIKMRGTVNSLNAAMAAGIIMWELMK